MNRADVERDYKIVDGIIHSPGKFEGEAVYIPVFWDAFLNGLHDSDEGGTISFDIVASDWQEFPELEGRTILQILEDENGFVREV